MMMCYTAHQKGERGREKDSFNPRSEVCTAAVVADLPRVRGEAETIVRLGLN